MDKRQKKLSIAAGVLLLIYGIYQVLYLLPFLSHYGSKIRIFAAGGLRIFLNILATAGIHVDIFVFILGVLLAGIFLLAQRRGVFIAIAFGTMAAAKLILLSRAFYWDVLVELLLYALIAVGAFRWAKGFAAKIALPYAYLPLSILLIRMFFMIQSGSLARNTNGLWMMVVLSAAYIFAGSAIAGVPRTEKRAKIHTVGLAGIISFALGAFFSAAIAVISTLFYRRVYFFDGYPITGVLWVIAFALLGLGLIAAPLAILYPGSLKKAKTESNATDEDAEGYVSLGKHIVLCLFTFGIWYLIWIYRTTNYLNRAPDSEQYNPASKLLLCIFVPFYTIYWFYKHGQRVDVLSKSKNLNYSDMATTCLILAIFIPIVACILLQDRINAICMAGDSVPASPQSAQIENLKKMKELLDSGVITQEEFDAKKKQILGL